MDFLYGIAAGVIGLTALAWKFKWVDFGGVWKRFFRERQVTPIVELDTEDLTPSPPPEPNFGNIRPENGEETDPDEFDADIIEFPEYKEPSTRYEDFNRRLIIWGTSDRGATTGLPTDDDFPTRLGDMNAGGLNTYIKDRLRPRYPVILDCYGWWARASSLLEMDPDYSDAVVDAYLAIPEARRPVVIVRQPALGDQGYISVYRYGFKTISFREASIQPYPRRCLSYMMDALIGDREAWLWFSIARMRLAVVRFAQAEATLRQALMAQERLLKEEELAKEVEDSSAGGSRWRILWGLRPPMNLPSPAEDEIEPSLPPAPEEPSQTEDQKKVPDHEAEKTAEEAPTW